MTIQKPNALTRLKEEAKQQTSDGMLIPPDVQELFLEKFGQPNYGGMTLESSKYGICIRGLYDEPVYFFKMSTFALTIGMGLEESYQHLVNLHNNDNSKTISPNPL